MALPLLDKLTDLIVGGKQKRADAVLAIHRKPIKKSAPRVTEFRPFGLIRYGHEPATNNPLRKDTSVSAAANAGQSIRRSKMFAILSDAVFEVAFEILKYAADGWLPLSGIV